MVKFGCFNKSKNNFFIAWESMQKWTGDIIQCVTGQTHNCVPDI